MFSGMGLRVCIFITLLSVSICYVMWHALRVKRRPELSSTYEQDLLTAKNVALNADDVAPLTSRQKTVLVVFILGIAFTVWGIVTQGYYIDELAAIFLAIGIVGGVVGRLKPGELCDQFEKVCVNMLFPCLMIGLANSVIQHTDSKIQRSTERFSTYTREQSILWDRAKWRNIILFRQYTTKPNAELRVLPQPCSFV